MKNRFSGSEGPPESTPRPSPDTESAGNQMVQGRGEDSASMLPARLERYGKARRRARVVLDHLRALDNGGIAVGEALAARRAAARLERCGEHLLFRHYYTVDAMRLHSAEFCMQHTLCQFCAVRRAAKQLAAYLQRLEAIIDQNGGVLPRLALMTYTVKNGPDLMERDKHLRDGLRRLTERRRDIRKGKRGSSEWGAIAGAVGALEITNRGNGWHPHAHMIVVLDRWLDQRAMSKEWHEVTGDSFVVGITRLDPERPLAEAFAEVFKYSLKFSDMEPAQVWQAARLLAGQRRIFSLGCFRGVQVPESLADEPLDGLPFVELLFRYIHGVGYSL